MARKIMLMLLLVAALSGCKETDGPGGNRTTRSQAIVDVLAAASEHYWSIEHCYPDTNPDVVGLGAIREFRARYHRNGGWTDEGLNVSFVYLLARPRNPEPLIDPNHRWFEEIKPSIVDPDGRKLHRVVDGFGNPIRIRRISGPSSGIVITSAGPDEDFETAKDNIEVRLRR